ncbi:uncharacterized protein TRIVIDRAFT_71023 [Trichoderma virens Gv29-8]|uniref:Glucose-methanol-choline oxidoreductase N-terminal domain-containing protein n=1 Tax=Hypocrea virens (strain Gv29-8 / FGSC 10586) TaxID=413071 RepID=G9MU38_HYPVG|nr:uncharacterized protein TRIVIDRAFT_71023 [Trichoderma virens Gv29-8]EHK22039.1 hypothetical protein TRIVIDRAFT_71023 [Trichoderma virens Gv29-8]
MVQSLSNIQPVAPVTSIEEFTRTSFDFLVCGGGTAGCTIAARLSEDPNITVGIIEAGKYRIGDPVIDTPAAFSQAFENPEYDWCFYTAPQEANHGKVHHVPRGKLLGGSSGINYMMYARGSSQDYDDWAALVDDEGWSAKNLQDYMRKHQVTLEPVDSAHMQQSPTLAREYHGATGPIKTSFNESQLPIESDIIKACAEVTGISQKPADAWSGDHIGFFHSLGTVARTGPDRGKRSYAGRDYYDANRSRPNLKVLCEAHVNKLILKGNRAAGVSLTVHGQDYVVSANQEVIISAGAIQSPQILELSGIGDPEVLKAAGVQCMVENPAVGNNLQDHSMSLMTWEVRPGVITLDTLSQVPEAMQAATGQYTATRSGPLSSIGSMQGFLPVKSILSATELGEVIQSIRDTKSTTPFHAQQLQQIIAQLESDHSANLQIVLVPATTDPAGFEHQSQLFPPQSADQPARVTAGLCLVYPVSRGYVHIQNNDPTTPPVIQPNYITHEADVSLVAAFLRWADRMGRAEALNSSIDRRSFPDQSLNMQDLSQAKQAVRDTIAGQYHICGSVAMGDALDSRLRVKGAERLRVVDASVFPNNISGNIVATVYAVAEKAADMIKEDYGLGDFAAGGR